MDEMSNSEALVWILVAILPMVIYGTAAHFGQRQSCFAAPPPERLDMQFPRSFITLATVLLFACSPAGKDLSTSNSTVALATAAQTQVARGLSFVEAQCSGCHAVRPGFEPPNPQAPGFVAVANDMGFKQDTLREFFRDGHDTPAAMSIQLEEDEADMAAAYIMSLRSSR